MAFAGQDVENSILDVTNPLQPVSTLVGIPHGRRGLASIQFKLDGWIQNPELFENVAETRIGRCKIFE